MANVRGAHSIHIDENGIYAIGKPFHNRYNSTVLNLISHTQTLTLAVFQGFSHIFTPYRLGVRVVYYMWCVARLFISSVLLYIFISVRFQFLFRIVCYYYIASVCLCVSVCV